MGTIIVWLIVIGIIFFLGLPTVIAIIAGICTILLGLLAYAVYLVPFLGFFILWRIIAWFARKKID